MAFLLYFCLKCTLSRALSFSFFPLRVLQFFFSLSLLLSYPSNISSVSRIFSFFSPLPLCSLLICIFFFLSLPLHLLFFFTLSLYASVCFSSSYHFQSFFFTKTCSTFRLISWQCYFIAMACLV